MRATTASHELHATRYELQLLPVPFAFCVCGILLEAVFAFSHQALLTIGYSRCVATRVCVACALEHYFQAQKFTDPALTEECRLKGTPRECFELAREPRCQAFIRGDWHRKEPGYAHTSTHMHTHLQAPLDIALHLAVWPSVCTH